MAGGSRNNRRYAEEVAFVAEEPPATNLATLAAQFDTAIPRYRDAGINGHEDLETAVVHLNEACNSDDETARSVFLGRADELLYSLVWSMTDEYRDMVGD